ncbi:hypothetical protein GCM10010121_098470 [Streptomyces brasiliensis]|uniref:Uncharacterized protein n=1 Tax=Streptomyces brasiliensis TaxID=1954 RepID=A0A917PDP9_9ACTN|nr:hypothetical protein GCM10010121_098470 [Streptomyces brasiliensis]
MSAAVPIGCLAGGQQNRHGAGDHAVVETHENRAGAGPDRRRTSRSPPHADLPGNTQRADSAKEFALTGCRSGERLRTKQGAENADHGRNVHVLMGVDTEHHGGGIGGGLRAAAVVRHAEDGMAVAGPAGRSGL